MKNRLISNFKNLVFPMLTFTLHVGASPSDLNFIELSDHVPTKALNQAVLMHPLDQSKEIHMNFVLPLRNQNELQDLITRIHNPADSEHYGKYLTSAEFIERFSPSQEDYDRVVAYANSLGLTVHDTHPNRTLLHVSGGAQKVESAFNLRLHQYALPKGRQFYAPSKNPEVHTSVASVISGIVGLDNHAKWHSYLHRREINDHSNASSQAFPSGPNGGFAPKDIVTAYNLSGVSADGTNQIIALFELGEYLVSDITAYTNYFGLPSPKLYNILVDGGNTDGIDAEVTLDIELAIALAPGSEIYVYEGPNSNQGVLDTYNRIATDNIAKQVSTSWGSGEHMVNVQYLQAESAIFQQMAVQGQTIYAAAGDSGAYDDYAQNSSQALVVDDPASQPYVIGVGGTRLTVNPANGAYETESVWNNGLGNGAGGGGVSTVWPIPSWQTNVSTVYSKTYRNVPDVALDADPGTGYAIYYNGSWQIYGGTSCAAPLWAAFTACVNQELAATQQPALGFANPKFYSIGIGSAYTSDFHDVTTGNNLYYTALQGYDNATGWGSFNGTNLYANLTNPPTPAPIPPAPIPPAPIPPAPIPPAPIPPAPIPPTPTPPAPAPIPSSPHCNIWLEESIPFIQGRIGTYEAIVSNTGNASTTSPVTVAITLPNNLSLHSFSGTGWVFNGRTLSFTQNHALKPGASFPPIVFSVNIAHRPTHNLVVSATVSGGGSPSETVTNQTSIR